MAALQGSRKLQAPCAGAFSLKDKPGTDRSVITCSKSDKNISDVRGNELFNLHKVGTLAQDKSTLTDVLKTTSSLWRRHVQTNTQFCGRLSSQAKVLYTSSLLTNKQSFRQFSSDVVTVPIINLISKQHWSQLKSHLQNTKPISILHQLLNSEADPELILRYFTWSQREFRCSHSIEVAFRILCSLGFAKKYSKIRSFLDDFVKNDGNSSVSSIFHVVSTSGDSLCVKSIIVDMLVLAYVKNLKTQLGFEAFKRAGDYGFKLSVVSCNPLLNALVKEGAIGDVEFVYTEMIKRRIEPDLFSFNIVINGLCKAGKLDKASDLVMDMKLWGVSSNVVTYNTLIDGYCKMGRIGKMYKADAILKEMAANGISRNEVTYNILIDGFCKDNNVSAAMKVFGEMQRQGCKPNAVTYNTLINGLCSDGKVHEAICLRDQMVSSGLKANIITYNTLINGYCKNQMVKEASELLIDMAKQEIAPNIRTYNTLIDVYCKDGRMEDAFTLCNLMLNNGFQPDVSTYNCLISGLCREGNMKDAMRLWEEMIDMNLTPDIVTYNILIDSLCNKGELKKAMRLLEEMPRKGLRPKHLTYNILMNGYCSKGNLRDALNLRMKMEKEGRRANVVTYNLLIKGFCKKGKLEAANKLLNEMLENGLVPNQITYEIVKEEMIEKGEHVLVGSHLLASTGGKRAGSLIYAGGSYLSNKEQDRNPLIFFHNQELTCEISPNDKEKHKRPCGEVVLASIRMGVTVVRIAVVSLVFYFPHRLKETELARPLKLG